MNCKTDARLETICKGFGDPAVRRNQCGQCALDVGWFSIFVITGIKVWQEGEAECSPGAGSGSTNRGVPVLPLQKCNIKSVLAEQDPSSPISSQKAQLPSSWHFLTVGFCRQCVLSKHLSCESPSKSHRFYHLQYSFPYYLFPVSEVYMIVTTNGGRNKKMRFREERRQCKLSPVSWTFQRDLKASWQRWCTFKGGVWKKKGHVQKLVSSGHLPRFKSLMDCLSHSTGREGCRCFQPAETFWWKNRLLPK